MPLREWLRPPQSLLIILCLLTLVSISALAWFGWRLLDQERLVEAQRTRERLEQAADRIVSHLRVALVSDQPDALVTIIDNSIAGKLLYSPAPARAPEADPRIFSEAESLEFVQGQPRQAADAYERLAESGDAAIRAGALMRLARVLRRLKRDPGPVHAKLERISGAAVAGDPADLVARDALAEWEAIRRDLLAGRWELSEAQFEYYWKRVSKDPPPEDTLALAEAATLVWADRNRNFKTQDTLWVRDRPFLIVRRGRALMVMRPAAVLGPVLSAEDAKCAVLDREGRLIMGERSGMGRAVVRTGAENQLPWTLYVTGTRASSETGTVARQRFLMSGIGIMVLFLVAGTYFIARAIRREIEVSRLQSDFVSAVSHEFRSPLTSIRHLSEILALGRVPGEERRQTYYDTLVRESQRLQRLVEALLNFGRMEAGRRQYQFEEMDASALVNRVAAEFESNGRIELVSAGDACLIEADPEALSVALRNLVDNALKYSPEDRRVWIEWSTENQFVAIGVRDHGAGIAEEEMKRIFQKFVRGSAAAAGNVKGTGVGLAMVRHIVAAHGGQIQVASRLGEGSTFTMLLPALLRAGGRV